MGPSLLAVAAWVQVVIHFVQSDIFNITELS